VGILGVCFGRMLWAYALSVCFACMLWAYALGVCFALVFWAYVFAVWFWRVFWAYALSVCFKCMALERMALGASLWVRGFGRMSWGVWILPKKPDAKDKIDNLNLCSSLSLCESVSNFRTAILLHYTAKSKITQSIMR